MKGSFIRIKEIEFQAEEDVRVMLEMTQHLNYIRRHFDKLGNIVRSKIQEFDLMKKFSLEPQRNCSVVHASGNFFSGMLNLYNACKSPASITMRCVGGFMGGAQLVVAGGHYYQVKELMEKIDQVSRELVSLESINNMFDFISRTYFEN